MSTQPTPMPVTPAELTKAGWKTSEFWMTIGTIGSLIAASATGRDVNAATAVGASVAAGIYSIVRMFLKKG